MIRAILDDPNLFPKVIIALYACSSTRYAWQGDFGRSLYWIAAALITIAVTFCIKH